MTDTATEATSANPTATTNDDASGDQVQLVSFWVGTEEFAVEILAVREINRMLDVTRVPEAPAYVEGVINLRGLIVPVVDLRKRFGVEATEANADTRIVVVEVKERMIGFIVDRVNEVLRLDRSIVDPAPDLAKSPMSQFISGVGKLEDRLIILLDVGLLVDDLALDEQALKAAA